MGHKHLTGEQRFTIEWLLQRPMSLKEDEDHAKLPEVHRRDETDRAKVHHHLRPVQPVTFIDWEPYWVPLLYVLNQCWRRC
jgi:hypothetical protein